MKEFGNPIFIGGTGRSGTSILAKSLSIHPSVLNFGETRFLIDRGGISDVIKGKVKKDIFKKNMLYVLKNRLISSLKNQGYLSSDIYNDKVMKRVFDTFFPSEIISEFNIAMFVRYIYEVGMNKFKKTVFIEKTPHTNIIVDFLYRTFKNIRYIHAIRDPRDIYCSMLCQKWGPKNVEDFIQYYNKNMIESWNSHVSIPDSNYLVCSIEKIVKNPKIYMKKILEFSCLSFDAKTLEYHLRYISEKNAHLNRWENELSIEDSDNIKYRCRNSYERWLNIEYTSDTNKITKFKIPRRPKSNR